MPRWPRVRTYALLCAIGQEKRLYHWTPGLVWCPFRILFWTNTPFSFIGLGYNWVRFVRFAFLKRLPPVSRIAGAIPHAESTGLAWYPGNASGGRSIRASFLP